MSLCYFLSIITLSLCMLIYNMNTTDLYTVKTCSLEKVQRESQVERSEQDTCHFSPWSADCEHSAHLFFPFLLALWKGLLSQWSTGSPSCIHGRMLTGVLSGCSSPSCYSCREFRDAQHHCHVQKVLFYSSFQCSLAFIIFLPCFWNVLWSFLDVTNGDWHFRVTNSALRSVMSFYNSLCPWQKDIFFDEGWELRWSMGTRMSI